MRMILQTTTTTIGKELSLSALQTGSFFLLSIPNKQ